MLKYSSLVLLVTVASFWSRVDAKAFAPVAYGLAKRDADNDDYSTESQEEIAKSLLAGLLLSKTKTSAEMDTLSEKFQEAFARKDWNSLDEFATYLVSSFHDVTHRKINENESDEISKDSDEA